MPWYLRRSLCPGRWCDIGKPGTKMLGVPLLRATVISYHSLWRPKGSAWCKYAHKEDGEKGGGQDRR